MKKEYLLLGLLFLTVVIISTVSIVKKYEQDSVVSTVMKTTSIDDFKNDYMSGCMEEGAGYGFCNCTFESLVKSYGYDGLMKESIEYAKTGVLSKKMSSVVTQCLE